LRITSEFLRHRNRLPNVPLLGRLVAAAEQDDQDRAALDEVDAIARPVVDPQFPDAGEELDVSEEAGLKANDTLGNALCGAAVGQASQPRLEFKRLANFYQV
jgi:hypothetical protein